MATTHSHLRPQLPSMRAPARERRLVVPPEPARRTSPLVVAALVGFALAATGTILAVHAAGGHRDQRPAARADTESPRAAVEETPDRAPRPREYLAPVAPLPGAAPAPPVLGRPLRKPDAQVAREFVAGIRASGATSARWSTTAVHALETFPASLKGELHDKVHLSGIECFKAGCIVEVRAENRDVLHSAGEELLNDPQAAFNQWPGLRQMAPPVIGADGTVASTWALIPEQE